LHDEFINPLDLQLKGSETWAASSSLPRGLATITIGVSIPRADVRYDRQFGGRMTGLACCRSRLSIAVASIGLTVLSSFPAGSGSRDQALVSLLTVLGKTIPMLRKVEPEKAADLLLTDPQFSSRLILQMRKQAPSSLDDLGKVLSTEQLPPPRFLSLQSTYRRNQFVIDDVINDRLPLQNTEPTPQWVPPVDLESRYSSKPVAERLTGAGLLGGAAYWCAQSKDLCSGENVDELVMILRKRLREGK
jgi:hypothetical protein